MKQCLIILVMLIVLMALFGESRKFYCIDRKCVTVWKTFNNNCYITPGKYFGLTRPSANYIHTTNSSSLTIYFAQEEPEKLFIKGDNEIKMYNDNQKVLITIVDNRDSKYDSLFYDKSAKRNNDLKKSAFLIDLIVADNYALDKDGRKL